MFPTSPKHPETDSLWSLVRSIAIMSLMNIVIIVVIICIIGIVINNAQAVQLHCFAVNRFPFLRENPFGFPPFHLTAISLTDI